MRFYKSHLADLDENIYLLIEEYVDQNLLKMASPSFQNELVCAVKDLLWEDCQHINLQECRFDTPDDEEEIRSFSSLSSNSTMPSTMKSTSTIHSVYVDTDTDTNTDDDDDTNTDGDDDNDDDRDTWISFVSDDTPEAYETWLQRRVERVMCSFFESRSFVPPRSNKPEDDEPECDSDEHVIDLRVSTISPILAKLRAAPQPEQRTDEWYKHRHELITASSAWKALASPAQQASLIREKCKPLQNHNTDMVSGSSRPVEDLGRLSSLQWGVVFEHVTAEIYAWKNNGVTIEEFGCIRHFDDDCRFLGASPDGIVVAPVSSPKYGKLIEIKNIVNRDIDGIPKEEYWVQMQLQMEVCDLDECDFVETRFKEFEDGETGFFSDTSLLDDDKHRGVILSFANVNMTTMETRIQRVYMPVDPAIVNYRDKSAVDEWINQTRNTMRAQKWMLNYTLYWYLDQYSCIPVERNRPWACAVMPILRDMWARVEAARISESTTEGVTIKATRTKPNAAHICFVKKLL